MKLTFKVGVSRTDFMTYLLPTLGLVKGRWSPGISVMWWRYFLTVWVDRK